MFIIQVGYFDLNKTFESGQALRWYKIDEYKYIIFHNDDHVLISQNKDKIIIEDTEENFFKKWYKYLTFDIDYDKAYYSFAKLSDKNIVKTMLKGTNIHLIRKSIFELIVTCILSYKNEIITRKTLDEIALVCGDVHVSSIRGLGKRTWYSFPTPEKIIENISNFTFLDINRKELLLKLSEDIVNGWISLDDLENATTKEEVFNILYGLLPLSLIKKVCLGKGITDAFPMTKTIKDIFKRKCIDKNSFAKNEYRGILYYLFMHEKEYPLAKQDWGIIYEYSRPNKKRRSRKRSEDTNI